MIKPQRLFNFLKEKIDFFTGVPDSILKELSPILENNHVIVPNKDAVGIASDIFYQQEKYHAYICKIQD